MFVAVAKQTDANFAGFCPIRFALCKNQLEVDKIVGAVASGFRRVVDFLRDLVGDGHEGNWGRRRKAECLEQVRNLRGKDIFRGVGIADFVVPDFKVNFAPRFLFVGKVTLEGAHDIFRSDAVRMGWADRERPSR